MSQGGVILLFHAVLILVGNYPYVRSDSNCQWWQKINDICHTCKPGYYGRNCTDHCPGECQESSFLRSVEPYCHQLTGTCQHGCHDSWWGHKCIYKCNEGCKHGKCYQQNGRCFYDGCSDGWYGRHCKYKCGNCFEDRCHKYSGMCKSGCKAGWSSAACRNKCIPYCLICEQDGRKCITCREGYHGENCDLCNSNCKGHICSNNGTCLDGCNTGFYGNDCSKQCVTGCRECDVKSGKCATTVDHFTKLFTPLTKIPPNVDIRDGQNENSPEYVTVQMSNSDGHTTARKQLSSGTTQIPSILLYIIVSSCVL